jgi:hypothetical protein
MLSACLVFVQDAQASRDRCAGGGGRAVHRGVLLVWTLNRHTGFVHLRQIKRAEEQEEQKKQQQEEENEEKQPQTAEEIWRENQLKIEEQQRQLLQQRLK